MKTKLLYVWLEPDRVVTFCTEAKRRRVSVDVIVNGEHAPVNQTRLVNAF
jgi:hypothetical protein